MTAIFKDSNLGFNSLSLVDIANSAMGNAVATGNYGWSISNLTAFTHAHSATEATAANTAKALATLIYDLAHRGIIKATGLPG